MSMVLEGAPLVLIILAVMAVTWYNCRSKRARVESAVQAVRDAAHLLEHARRAVQDDPELRSEIEHAEEHVEQLKRKLDGLVANEPHFFV